MKKLIFILTLLFCAGEFAQAQSATTMKTRRLGINGFSASGTYVAGGTKTIDTCTNATDTVYFFADATLLIQGSFQMTAKLISGTGVITGYLEQSADGVSWYQKALGDTINLKPTANGTKVGGLVITTNTAKYFRYRLIGHNTAAVQLTGYSYARRD